MKQHEKEEVINYFLNKEKIDYKKLQILLYYTEAWANTLYRKSPFYDIKFVASNDGPSCFSFNDKYDLYDNIIIKQSYNIEDKDLLELLEKIWNNYGHKSANELEIMSKKEKPWIIARNYSQSETSIIKVDNMIQYFKDKSL